MKTTGLRTATHFKALAMIIDTMERQGHVIGEDCEAGYNVTSGYIYVWSEDIPVSYGITDYAYNRGEEVECIFSEFVTGEEFIGSSIEDVENQYNEWFCCMVEDGRLFEEDRCFLA
jgi:hypothetical protein